MIIQATPGRPTIQEGPGSHIRMDRASEQLLHLLAQRGRVPARELADRVGLSESSVRERVSALELRGLVMGYEARIDWALAGLPMVVLIEGYCPPGRAGEVAGQLNRIPNVVQAMCTTGAPNVFAVVRARDTHDVRKLFGLLAATSLVNVGARIMLERLVVERQPPLFQPSAETVKAAVAAPLMAPTTGGHHGPPHPGLQEELAYAQS